MSGVRVLGLLFTFLVGASCTTRVGGAGVYCDESYPCVDARYSVCSARTRTCVEAGACPATGAPCPEESPTCRADGCYGCTRDSDCRSGICLGNWVCANETDMVHVDPDAPDCAGGDGSALRPLCEIADGLA